jgi:hypothetical protein
VCKQANVFPAIIPTFFFLAGAAMGGVLWWTGNTSRTLWASLFATCCMGNLLVVNQIVLYLTFDKIRQFCRKELYNLPQQVSTVPLRLSPHVDASACVMRLRVKSG